MDLSKEYVGKLGVTHENGQEISVVTIPNDMRKQLGIKHQDKIKFSFQNNSIVITKFDKEKEVKGNLFKNIFSNDFTSTNIDKSDKRVQEEIRFKSDFQKSVAERKASDLNYDYKQDFPWVNHPYVSRDKMKSVYSLELGHPKYTELADKALAKRPIY